jgi:hypothetical protein
VAATSTIMMMDKNDDNSLLTSDNDHLAAGFNNDVDAGMLSAMYDISAASVITTMRMMDETTAPNHNYGGTF